MPTIYRIEDSDGTKQAGGVFPRTVVTVTTTSGWLVMKQPWLPEGYGSLSR
jgi:hypothetical protein